METDPLLKIVLFFVLILFSAFFSGSEAAFFSLSKERLKENLTKRSIRVTNILKKPKHLLGTILVGNTIVTVAAVSVIVLLTLDLCEYFQLTRKTAILTEVVIVSFVLLLFSELIPKIIAVKNPNKFAETVSLPMSFFNLILFPVNRLFSRFPTLFSGIIATRVKKNFLSKEEFKTLIEFSEERGTLEEDEKEMIRSIFEFSKTTVREIMVPRIDMVCVEKGTPLEKLIGLIHQKGHTRIPLYDEKVDNILGIIHAKGLLPFINNKKGKADLVSLARPALFVPESKRLDELLNEIQAEKQHMAIVVDGYGGTAGLITLEDIIEEIVGEIQDEYDKEKPLVKKIDETHYLIDAKIDTDELNEELDLDLPQNKSYESLGGLIFELIGSVPEAKQEIEYGSYRFIIEKIDKNRIVQVLLVKESNKERDNNS